MASGDVSRYRGIVVENKNYLLKTRPCFELVDDLILILESARMSRRVERSCSLWAELFLLVLARDVGSMRGLEISTCWLDSTLFLATVSLLSVHHSCYIASDLMVPHHT